jgi:hypothetical protein
MQKDVYERHKTELLAAGGSSLSTPTSATEARKKAAKEASLVNHDTNSMYQFTSVMKNGPGGGTKRLRGTHTTRALTDHRRRTGRLVEKTPTKGGKSYTNEMLRCKHPGCSIEREHLRLADGSLSSATGNLMKHIHNAHPRHQRCRQGKGGCRRRQCGLRQRFRQRLRQ